MTSFSTFLRRGHTALKNPSMLKLYAPWVAAKLSRASYNQDLFLPFGDVRLSGFPKFTNYWGSWRYRPDDVERSFIARSVTGTKTVIDIGANLGIVSILAQRAEPSAQVFAFEPNPSTANALRRNCERNGCGDVKIIETAVGSKIGTIGFTDTADPATNRIESDGPLQVELTTLDEWLSASEIMSIDFLKIDVEGAEIDVLRGARTTFLSKKIRSGMIEICPGTLARFGKTVVDVHDMIADFGYELFWLEDPSLALTRDRVQSMPAHALANAGIRPCA